MVLNTNKNILYHVNQKKTYFCYNKKKRAKPCKKSRQLTDFLIEALTKCARKKSVSVEGEANIQNVSGKRLNVNHGNESKSVGFEK